MAYEINASRVAGVVIEASKAIDGHSFNHGEVVLGLAELIGRVTLQAASTKIQADELVQAATAHMKRTIDIGAQATDKRIITER